MHSLLQLVIHMKTKTFNLHLVSDSTGETVSAVARSVLAQFERLEPNEFMWSLVRTKGQMERVVDGIVANPGIVIYTVSDKVLRRILKEGCDSVSVPCISVISRVINALSEFMGVSTSIRHMKSKLDEDYFDRIDAINYSLTHDDGQSNWDLEDADIIIIGASRTSKSPTSMYLANRGYRTANIPFIDGMPLPEGLEALEKTFIVGLTIIPDRLLQIRKSRLLSINEHADTQYVDIDMIKKEIVAAKKLYTRKKWPVIDVTRKSVEETAAHIIQLHQKFKKESKFDK